MKRGFRNFYLAGRLLFKYIWGSSCPKVIFGWLGIFNALPVILLKIK